MTAGFGSCPERTAAGCAGGFHWTFSTASCLYPCGRLWIQACSFYRNLHSPVIHRASCAVSLQRGCGRNQSATTTGAFCLHTGRLKCLIQAFLATGSCCQLRGLIAAHSNARCSWCCRLPGGYLICPFSAFDWISARAGSSKQQSRGG